MVKQNKNMKLIKRQGSTELPRFIVGALATAGASVAGGATVQIAFGNNILTSNSALDFTPDVTGDGTSDMTWRFSPGSAMLYWGGNYLIGWAHGGASAKVVLGGGPNSYGFKVVQVRGLVPFEFSDTGINGNARTSAWLEMDAYSAPLGEKRLQIHRLIFDDTDTVAPTGVSLGATYPTFGVSAVPEPGSNFALLALGAGGLTLRRRLKRAA